jgi:glycosyltransferase involved in cell wall biosynthesis
MLNLVSIVIPCYNAEKYISEAINSCLDQIYNEIEIIVVNDGSTDKSSEIIKTFGDKVKIIEQVNKGGSEARNAGLRIARGEFVKFLDADDFLEKDIIEKQLSHFEKFRENEPVAVYGNINMVNEKGEFEWLRVQPKISEDQDGLTTLIESAIVTSSPLYRKSDLIRMGGFNESLTGNQEHELNIRLFLSGVRFRHFNDVVYNHRNYNSESRISCRRWPEKDPYFTWRLIEHYKKLLEDNNIPVKDKVAAALATRLVGAARLLIKTVNKTLAEDHLKSALEICPERNFRVGKRYWITKYYLLACQLFGFKVTESVYSNLKNIIKFR